MTKIEQILWLLIFSWPILAPAQPAYYYVDSGCEGCRLEPGGRLGRYWVISDEVHPFMAGDGRRELDLIKADYKAGLAAGYANYAVLTQNVTVRRKDSREEAERARRRKIEEMREKGYQVVETPFWFYSHRGIPELDRYLVYAEKLGFDGVVLLAENDWVVHRRGYGLARTEGSLVHNPHIVFPIGEMTQVFTAQAVFLLREAGRLDLTDNLGKIFRNAPVDKKSITVKQLLMHTAGLDRDIPPGDFSSSADVLDAILDSELVALPGQQYRFSNAGYQLLALIIQKITRQTYDEFLREQILEPLQLRNTGFFHQPPHPRLVADARLAGASQAFRSAPAGSSVYLGSHGLLSTAEDLFRWFRTLSKLPFFPEMARYQNGRDWAYGVLALETGQVIMKGQGGAYHTRLTYDRTRRRLIIVLSNTDLQAGGAHTSLITRRAQEIMEGKKWEGAPAPSIQGEWLAGVYTAPEDTLWITESEGRLQLMVSGQSLVDQLTAGRPVGQDGVREKARQCAAALRTTDWASLEQVIDRVFIDSLRQYISDARADFGPLMDVVYRGTAPLHDSDVRLRSFFDFYFAGKKMAFRLDWEGDELAGWLPDTGPPAIWWGYLIPTSDQELTCIDLLTDRRDILRFSPDGQMVSVGEMVLSRAADR